MLIQLGSYIYVTPMDSVKEEFGNSLPLHVDKVRLEEGFGGFKSFSSNLRTKKASQNQVYLDTPIVYYLILTIKVAHVHVIKDLSKHLLNLFCSGLSRRIFDETP